MSQLSFNKDLQVLRSSLISFALNLTKDYENAEDLLQETYFRAIKNRDKFVEGTNLKAWLLTIMKNIFINNYRRKMKTNTIFDSSDNQYLLNSGGETIGNAAESQFVMADLQKAINDLSADYKIPFLKHFQGYKYQEIADEMDLPLGTVKSRIFFARKQIKESLAKIGFVR